MFVFLYGINKNCSFFNRSAKPDKSCLKDSFTVDSGFSITLRSDVQKWSLEKKPLEVRLVRVAEQLEKLTRDNIWPNIFIASTIIDFQVPAESPSMEFHNVSKSVMYLAGKSFNLSMMYWIIFFTAHPKDSQKDFFSALFLDSLSLFPLLIHPSDIKVKKN